jgi:hypothetical protein
MHARIDRQNVRFRRNTVTATSWKTRPEEPTVRMCSKLLQWMRPGLYTGMDVCRNSDRTSTTLDLDPWGVCAPLGTLNVPQKIPPTESAAIWLETIVSSNDEMGRKGFSDLPWNICMQRQMSVQNDCALNSWMNRSARFHRRNLMIDGSMEAPWLDLYWVGMNLQSGHRSTADLESSK